MQENLHAFETFLYDEVPRLPPGALLPLFDDIMLCQELLLRCVVPSAALFYSIPYTHQIRTFKTARRLLRTPRIMHTNGAIAKTVSSMCVDLEDALWLLRDAVLALKTDTQKHARPTLALQPPPALLVASPTADQLHSRMAAAQQGDADAALEVGLLLLFGVGTPADSRRASELISSAAAAGLPDALYWLGLLCEHGLAGADGSPDWPRALSSLAAAADKGHTEAAMHLGLLLEGGAAGEVDAVRAVVYYRSAARGGAVAALNNLGRMLLEGRGCDVDACEVHA